MTRHPSLTTPPDDARATPPGPSSPPSPGCTLVRRRRQDGITTAEYAVGTAAGAGLAGLLSQLPTGGFGERRLRHPFDPVLGLLGIG